MEILERSHIGGKKMQKAKLANELQFDCDYMDHSEKTRQANVRVLNMPFAKAAEIFSDPNNTRQIWFENDYAAGFTKLLLMVNEDDAIRVVLGKE